MRAGGRLFGELTGGEGALQGVVLVLDLLQLEVLPLRRSRAKTGPGTNSQNGTYGRLLGIFNVKPVQISKERAVLDRCELELSHEFYISALGD